MWPLIEMIKEQREEEFEFWYSTMVAIVYMNGHAFQLPAKSNAKQLYDLGYNVYDALVRFNK